MANLILTAQAIAREALPLLKNNLVVSRLVRTDYKDEFKGRFDTVNIRKPPVLQADEFNGTASIQDAAEDRVPVSLDKLATVDVALDSREMSVVDFMKDIGESAIAALAQKVDSDLAKLALSVPASTGTAGTAPSTLADLAAPMKALNIAKAPLADRFAIVDPEAHAKLVQLENLVRVDASGADGALRDASIGRVYGTDYFMSQNVAAHTAGTLDAGATVTGSKGATTATIAAGGSGKTLLKGDLFKIAGTTVQFVVTADVTTASDGSASISFYPALPFSPAAKAVTLVADHTANVMFNRNAFALVTRPLAPAQGAESYSTAYDGLPIRVTFTWDPDTKKQRCSFDLLYGVACLYPELAIRMLG